MNKKPFNIKPHLASENLTLRPLLEEDFNGLYAVVADKKMWAGHPDKNRYQMPIFAEWFANAIASKTALVVIDKATKLIIGTSRFYYYDKEKSEVAIGYTFIAREYWGGKTNKELKYLMLDYAFKHVEIVYLHVAVDNIRSQKAVLKIGGVFSHDGYPHPDPKAFRKIYKFTKTDFTKLIFDSL